MILFGLSLCAILTSAHNHYSECFNNTNCEKYYDEKIYCYAGTCTDRCPPGYIQVNTDDGWHFECVCDGKEGFVHNEYFGGEFMNLNISKCKCNRDFCFVVVYAEGIGYTDGLIPYGAPPNCKIDLENIPPVLTRFVFYMVLIMLAMLMLIHCRSTSGTVYDFHRYYGIYVLGSTMVVVFVQTVYPFTAGFTRTMAFGIIAHNSAEWNLLLRLEYGKTSQVRNSSNVCIVIYYIILLLAIAFLRLDLLLYAAMIQGGFLDWTFVVFIFTARKALENGNQSFHPCFKSKYGEFVCGYGIGAIFHLLTVEVLFAGFILNDATLIGAGGFLLVPTFVFYMAWVIGQERLIIFCGPSVFMNYVKAGMSSTKFLIVPFKHTTRTVDILWKRFVGEGYAPAPVHHVDVEMESLEVEQVDDGKVEQVDSVSIVEVEDTSAKGSFGFSTSGKFEVEDCASFKFGVSDYVRQCATFDCCCGKVNVPLYWVAAFISITINTIILIQLPVWKPAEGKCNTGYDFGAW